MSPLHVIVQLKQVFKKKDIISFSQLNVRLKPLQNVIYHVVKLTV